MTVLATPCPSCGDTLDMAANMFNGRPVPKDGDVSICAKCGHVMVFERGRPRNPTNAEMYDIAGDPRLLLLQRARNMTTELFCVYQFFKDGSCERVREFVPIEEALKAVEHYCTSVGARMGVVEKVIITDTGDLTCFMWERDKGITFPKPTESK